MKALRSLARRDLDPFRVAHRIIRAHLHLFGEVEEPDQLFAKLASRLDAAFHPLAHLHLLEALPDNALDGVELEVRDHALGYYPVVNVNGTTIYVPCTARLQAIAAGGADPEVLDNILATQVAAANSAKDLAVGAASDVMAAVTEVQGSIDATQSLQRDQPRQAPHPYTQPKQWLAERDLFGWAGHVSLLAGRPVRSVRLRHGGPPRSWHSGYDLPVGARRRE